MSQELVNDPALRARAIRRAILHPDRFLAAALAELDDATLADALGARPSEVWALRLCGYPRAACWDSDMQAFATLVDGDASLVEALLHERGVRP